MEQHRIAGDGIGAAIKADGAELCVLQDRDGRDLLWDAGPLWPSHAPVLFPIVGRVAGDQVQINGHAYPLSRHGFARRRRFAWVERSTTRCSLELRDDEATRAVYPFGFQLELTYAIENGGLRVDYALRNPGTELLPASLGAHPAFRWPLREGAQTEYRLEFADDEAAPIHRLAGGLLDPADVLSPIHERVLPLDPALFHQDAIIMLEPRSRRLRYVGPGGGLEFSWDGFPQLGLWQKPGADFICIEPWHGYSSPLGWSGELRDKPGIMMVAPGETRHFSWSVRPIG
ncbi:MAG: aldose 1-epimerase family protein [Pseudomonadota bacterium]|nr:aldose 1-epimerase family protein [Pseudomonadota bacterium]